VKLFVEIMNPFHYLADIEGYTDIIIKDISLLEKLILPTKKIISENI